MGVTERSIRAEVLAIAALFSGFIAVVLWFDWVDFYHRHFFDTGTIVLANNVARVLFVAIFSWLVYVPGAGVASLIISPSEQNKLTRAERAVLGFGIGIGIWHVAMLLIGILGLYYRIVMVGLCLTVLVTSARHFANVAIVGWRAFVVHFTELWQRRASTQPAGATLIVLVAAWLLLLRGLYPGGGGDYYTHYFYYYLEALKNHGLAPNDVWYHYYYSKGSGLAFLGMLLTDPEAPALTTYPCVVFAGLAMATLAERMAPNSLWPATGALVYLLFYLINNGHAFQKEHEATTAFVVLTTWALCMERHSPSRPFRVMATSCAIAAAIATQSIGILLALFVGLLCVWSALHRRWSEMWAYCFIAAAIALTVFAVFWLSYLTTGLASDQPLDPMLRFADYSRLDRWGVIPQVITVAWIRDNYLALVPPFGWLTFRQLAQFMRLGSLWPFLLGPFIALVFLCAMDGLAHSKRKTAAAVIRVMDKLAGIRIKLSPHLADASFAAATAARLAVLLGILVVIALVFGRFQSDSFVRLSTFFVPLLVMLGTAGTIWVLAWKGRSNPSTIVMLPIILIVLVVVEWQMTSRWTKRIPVETANAFRFFSGQFSLADAYTRAESPFSFGAINPGAYAAALHLPSGTPIWSTNVDSYCMVPGCLIESVVSFKMSGHLDEILGGDPNLAKRRLQEAKLNYFLFMKDYRMLDLLPYSRLFAPEVIGDHLGVKWSDGSTFLLTWIGPDTTPIGSDFLDAYTRRRTEPDTLRWFRFDELALQIVAMSPRLRTVTKWWIAPDKLLTWR